MALVRLPEVYFFSKNLMRFTSDVLGNNLVMNFIEARAKLIIF